MKIDILGAGIGGLTTAVALEQKGIDYTIYESAETIKLAGTGIIMANNAMQVFQKLGLREELEALGNHISSLNITEASLKTVSKVDLSYFEQKYQVKNVAVHRGVLQQMLLKHIDTSKLKLGKRLVQINKEHPYTLKFDDGTTASSQAIIGADGIHSVVRKEFFPKFQIRKAKQVCWRGVVKYELPQDLIGELKEAWYNNLRFGFVQIAKDKVYWYALTTFNNSIDEHQKDQLKEKFNKFHPIVGELIGLTPVDQIHTDEVSDLKPISSWATGNVCLLGDAAHAMTPNLGQGACQAIEDAYVLSECLEKYPLQEAFKKYQKLRIAKAQSLVKTSWHIGKMAHVKNPFLAKCVNFMLKNSPEVMRKKQSEKLFKIATV
ncbi:FAD-dependent monooxygenase [Pseudofulvibacter geojedonensis]|uniref:FAD-dependent monooxygenase n=1 Tax=Pseudofulvibacter geojedonensis TaxID=1123758 RepID=A0ABW3HZV8_9FLAO